MIKRHAFRRRIKQARDFIFLSLSVYLLINFHSNVRSLKQFYNSRQGAVKLQQESYRSWCRSMCVLCFEFFFICIRLRAVGNKPIKTNWRNHTITNADQSQLSTHTIFFSSFDWRYLLFYFHFPLFFSLSLSLSLSHSKFLLSAGRCVAFCSSL